VTFILREHEMKTTNRIEPDLIHFTPEILETKIWRMFPVRAVVHVEHVYQWERPWHQLWELRMECGHRVPFLQPGRPQRKRQGCPWCFIQAATTPEVHEYREMALILLRAAGVA